MGIGDWSAVADQNTTISGINIAEGCPPGGINDAIRQMMADVKTAVGELDAAIAEAVRKSMPAGSVLPFYRVSLGGTGNRNPVFWGQTAADTGWFVCDGGSDGAGGTVPDLRDRFIRGASSPENAGSTGGADSVTPTVTVASAKTGAAVQATTLTTNQMPGHSHPLARASRRFFGSQYNDGGGRTLDGVNTDYNYTTIQTEAAGGSQSHTHGLTDNGHTHTAQISAVSTVPPFFKLIYCVKLPAN